MGGGMVMTALVKFPLENNDGFVLVEVDDGAGTTLTSPSDAEQASTSFQSAVSKLRPISQAVMEQVKALAPKGVTIEIGVKFSAEAGVILAKTSGEGTCKVTISW
jgi:hypothetical protein